MKFTIDGRKLNSYELSNEQVLSLYKSNKLTQEEKAEITTVLVSIYENYLCPRFDENYDDVFVRFFSDFVNGKLRDKTHVAEAMCNEHRYLQNEMFKVFMAFVKRLDECYVRGRYDGRNEYACTTASLIIESLKEKNWPY